MNYIYILINIFFLTLTIHYSSNAMQITGMTDDFQQALLQGDNAYAFEILDANEGMMFTIDSKGRSPLYIAAKTGNKELVKKLIKDESPVICSAKNKLPSEAAIDHLHLSIHKKISQYEAKNPYYCPQEDSELSFDDEVSAAPQKIITQVDRFIEQHRAFWHTDVVRRDR